VWSKLSHCKQHALLLKVCCSTSDCSIRVDKTFIWFLCFSYLRSCWIILLAAVRCSQMQSDAVRCSQMQSDAVRCSLMQSDAVWCSQMQSDVVRCSQMQSDAVRCSLMQSDAVWCSQMQSDAVRCNLMQSSRLHIPRDSSWAPRSVCGLSVWPLRYQQEWQCNCDFSQHTSTFCVCRLLPLLSAVLYSCLMTMGPQYNKYTVVLDRKCERLFVDLETPTGWQSSNYTVFLPPSHQELPTISRLVILSSQVPRPYCMFLMQTYRFKFTLTNAFFLKSTKLLFEIVNFSIYQKSIRSGLCFKPLLSPFWSLRFHFYNSNIRRTSRQDLGAL
jgi:hypothetical protein